MAPIVFSCPCGHGFAAEVVRVVDARDASMAERATAGSLHELTCPACKVSSRAELPFAYHDDRTKTCILVLPAGMRHRDLEERAAFLLELARSGHDIPAYVRDFKVAFSAAGLAKCLAERRRDADRAAELDVREAAIKEREDEQVARGQELGREAEEQATRIAELETLSAELSARKKELDEREAELTRRQDELPPVPEVAGLVEMTMAGDTTRTASVPLPTRTKNAEDTTNPIPRGQSPGPGIFGAVGKITPVDSFKTTEEWGAGLRAGGSDSRDDAVDAWIESRSAHALVVDKGKVRLLCRVGADQLEAMLAGPLSLRILLHRLPTYPLVVLALGRWGEGDAPVPLAFPLDLQKLEDRQVLGALASSFRVIFDLYDPDYLPVVHRELDEPLGANVRWVLTSAEAHLASIPSSKRSFDGAVAEWNGSGFDRYGSQPVALEEDSFALLPSVGATKVALGIISHWTKKEHEEYLVAVRSFPLDWWRRIRSRVISRAVEFGLAMPAAVIDVALEQGLARSRRELLGRVLRAFTEHVKARKAPVTDDKSGKAHVFDLEPADVTANWKALVADCEADGVVIEGDAAELASAAVGRQVAAPVAKVARPITVQPRSASIFGGPPEGPSLGKVAAAAAASVERSAPVPPAPRGSGVPELIPQTVSQEMTRPRPDLPKLDLNHLLELLDDTVLRKDVALEVCRRKEPFGVGPVFGALRRMTRGEAVRVIPAVVQFGERAVPHLVDGLRSRKAYLRQGCALALGILKNSDGIDPLCDLLLSEPTDVWREIARAIGEIGPGVVMSLAARVRDAQVRGGDGAPAEARERIAWALAHVAGRGGRGPIDTLAAGRDAVASGVAKRALELSLQARENDAEVRGPNPPRDQTVNRAFSRRFFEAMNGGTSSERLRAAAGDSSGTIPLDDSQIVEGDDESAGDDDILADR